MHNIILTSKAQLELSRIAIVMSEWSWCLTWWWRHYRRLPHAVNRLPRDSPLGGSTGYHTNHGNWSSHDNQGSLRILYPALQHAETHACVRAKCPLFTFDFKKKCRMWKQILARQSISMCKIVLLDFVQPLNYKRIKLRFRSWNLILASRKGGGGHRTWLRRSNKYFLCPLPAIFTWRWTQNSASETI